MVNIDLNIFSNFSQKTSNIIYRSFPCFFLQHLLFTLCNNDICDKFHEDGKHLTIYCSKKTD